ncbi:MAG: rRNA adenine dimethyltransferase family protein [Candidatus Jorgensenbacteria bacterium]
MGQRLGQHFLSSKLYLHRIVGALELGPNDAVVEIGPGHGELTRKIIAQLQDCKSAKFVAIEKDGELANRLIGELADRKNIRIVHGDVLKALPEIISSYQLQITDGSTVQSSPPMDYKLIGNIPFYLTGRLLRVISELKTKPKLTVLTVQKEVAERICAQPKKMNPVRGRPAEGTATAALGRPASNGMNLLAASVQVWATPEIVGHIPRKAFSPPPKVDSAIVKLTTISNYPITKLPDYYRLLKILFRQPRKTIINNLRKKGDDAAALAEKLRALGIDPEWRPQNLTVATIVQLSGQLEYNEKL